MERQIPPERVPDPELTSWWSRLGAPRAHRLLLHNQLLGERLYLYSLARFLVVGAIAAGALFATYVVGIEQLETARLLGVAGALGFYNLIVFVIIRPYRDRERSEAAGALLTGVMHATILLDFLFLTIALWLVGGARSPFQVFYMFNVILASVLLSRKAAFLHTFLGYLLLAGLVIGEWRGWIPTCSPVGAVSTTEILDGRYVVTLLAVYGTLFALSVMMLTSLVQLLRSGEERLREANDQLESISSVRRDFLQIVLHDLRTPIVAVSQHLYNIEAQLSGKMSEQESRWLSRCQTRIKELMAFLNDLQVLAVLESEGIRKQARPIALRSLVNAIVAESQDLARLRNHTLVLECHEDLPDVNGIERLVREAIMNLITNALKYTPNGGRIVVRAARATLPRGPLPKRVGSRSSATEHVRIEVEDNGIGISKENQKLLFQEFGRIRPAQGANLDITGSSGLGLAIVRRIVSLHGGRIAVESELNKGSTFSIELPTATDA